MLKVSVFHENILMEGEEFILKCVKPKSKKEIYLKEILIKMDKFI